MKKKAATPARKARPTKATKKTATKTAKKTAKKTAPARASQKFGRRADLGAPIEGFFARQAPHLRAILDELRRLVNQAAPAAASSIKWGMPFFTVGGNTLCALAAFKSHVNLILPGPPGTYADPEGRLEGDGKTGKHLKLRTLADLPETLVGGWLRTAADRAGARTASPSQQTPQ